VLLRLVFRCLHSHTKTIASYLISLKIENFNRMTFPILHFLDALPQKLQGVMFRPLCIRTCTLRTLYNQCIHEPAFEAALQIDDVTDSDFGARLEFRSV